MNNIQHIDYLDMDDFVDDLIEDSEEFSGVVCKCEQEVCSICGCCQNPACDIWSCPDSKNKYYRSSDG